MKKMRVRTGYVFFKNNNTQYPFQAADIVEVTEEEVRTQGHKLEEIEVVKEVVKEEKKKILAEIKPIKSLSNRAMKTK